MVIIMAKKISEKERNKKKKKRKGRKIIKKISAVVVLVALLAVILYFALRISPKEETVAVVNGESITKNELNRRYNMLSEQYKLFVTKDAFLDRVIESKLLLQEARRRGIDVSNEEVENEIDELKKRSTAEAFNEFLNKNNLSLEELKEMIKEQLIINKLLNQTVFSRIDISKSKIEDYYRKNKDLFQAKEGEIRVRHILVQSEEEAKEILRELQKGVSFEELAKTRSIDIGSAKRGGDLGFIRRGQTVKEFEDAAFRLKVKQISPIVKTSFGYHIIKREADIIPFSEAKEQIKEMLTEETSNLAIETYIQQLKSNATIIKGEVKVTNKIESFKKTDDNICKENGKPVIRLFSTSKCEPCNWIKETFDGLAKKYDNIVVYHWQLDTGDNLISEEKEKAIPKKEIEIFKKYNPKSTVPTYIFGCKFVRIGNAYESLEEEQAEFDRVIEKLIS